MTRRELESLDRRSDPVEQLLRLAGEKRLDIRDVYRRSAV